ncbi:helicase-exonuclease AddAB subunit AddA [Levilactobacillus parabrevis]|uniref:ATP-dependent helicase/nuclease subunit A n=2 Tax=Levilactobacillus parabrevis TaxID=357278 RepID=A0A0R1GVH6_9LACO|nr:helicase-exonuclease AddAB subunit AddA [Levilactobacillus parabrevis]KRK38262.1 ATP-dependent exoDNAse (exonuclease V) beta subunit [Levilactobacillus parabrevis ATCC 53295]KRO06516.1 ATP-dependent exoDNAse (exonuclease V) beta subunit [Levilactobacillus parabrevis]
MAKFEFTPSQDQAIHENGNNLLVSASAGSGKTRVLVQRVIEKLKAGTGIDEVLIVTFTKAAAAEMRERIQTALRQELATSQGDSDRQSFYLRQLNQLPVADISTLDAFCLRVLQHYYYVIDMDPVFRLLADETENALLRDEVWVDVREQLYAEGETLAKDGEQNLFARLTENFSGDRNDDGLAELVQRTYTFANATADPAAWLTALPEPYHLDSDQLSATSFYREQLQPLFTAQLQQIQVDLTSAQQLAEQANLTKQFDHLTTVLSSLKATLELVDHGSWNALRAAVRDFNWGRMPSVRKTNEDYAVYNHLKTTYYDPARKQLETLKKGYLIQPEEQAMTTIRRSGELVGELARAVTAFRNAYAAEKQRRHVLDFADVEHAALEILTRDTDQSRQVAAQLRQQYAEIMVDEYQDTNGLQEAILTAIAKPAPTGNLFMVGDVKQSIYRFRQADPTLFMDKTDRYSADQQSGKLIVLAENFRSMKNVDDFTNLIFKQLMDRELGEIDYTGAAQLKFGATYYPEDVTSTAELLVYLTDGDEKASGPADSEDQEPMDATFQVDNKHQGEVLLTGKKIQELIAAKTPIYDRDAHKNRPIKYGDITLLTPTRTNNLIITDELRRLGIPVVVNDAQNYFKTTEIQIMMALLRIIDNPYQDIPLAAVLRSPIVGLNENELAALRINQRTGDYYQAVLHYQQTYAAASASDFQQTLYEKISHFLEQLERFRDVARQNQLVTLIWQIYQDTGFLDYVGGMPAGEQRQANLHALYERAQSYEHSSFKGLFQFVRFVERLQERDDDLAGAPVQAAENAVSVMTIHGSKGLEFPVVFIMDASRQFNRQDQQGSYVMSGKQGIGIDYLDPVSRIKAPSLQKLVTAQAISRASLAEEMRKLYVALTRAESQIYIVGSHKTKEEALSVWEQAFQSPNLVLNATLREKSTAANYLDWIGMCLIRDTKFEDDSQPAGESLAALAGDPTNFKVSFATANDLGPAPAVNEATVDWFKETSTVAAKTAETVSGSESIRQVMDFSYPHEAATQTTAYQSVSEAKRLFEDPDNATIGEYQPVGNGQRGRRFVTHDFARPEFLQTVRAPLPTEIGTATHLVLQQLDVTTTPTVATIQAKIDQLVADQVLTSEVAAQVRAELILQFFTTPVGQQILAHPAELHREVPFSLLMPAKSLFQDFKEADSQVLVHGIVDGYLQTESGIILFDYKTDHVNTNAVEQSTTKIIDRYSGQVNLYAAALQQMTGQSVTAQYLYLLTTGALVSVPSKQVKD